MDILRFSIVIPTRERHETLRHTLRTCLAQNFDSYEIVVCDNFSSSSTKEVVDEFNSSKIMYFRSSKPLSMSDNWELAVSHALGEYIIVIGDDDGLLLHALHDIDYLLKILAVKVLRWDRICYEWPDVALADPRWLELSNTMSICLLRGNSLIKSNRVIARIANNSLDYQKLPMLYNSAIHRDLINTLIVKTGRIFSSSIPDVYSGYALAYLAKSYASIGRPMSINGSSSKSNGLSVVCLKSTNLIAKEFHKMNEESHLHFHPKIPNVKVMPAIIAEPFQRAKDLLFANDIRLSIDRKMLVKKCISALVVETKEEWQDNISIIKDSLQDDIKLLKWFNSIILTMTPEIRPDGFKISPFRKGFDGSNLNLSGDDFNIKNVFDVAIFYEKLTAYMQNEVEWERASLNLFQSRLRSALRILLKGF